MEDPAHDALSVDYEGQVTRLRVLPRAAACVAEFQVAHVDDEAWGPAAATTLPGVRRTAAGRCPDADLSWSREGQIATIDGKRWVVTEGSGQLRHGQALTPARARTPQPHKCCAGRPNPRSGRHNPTIVGATRRTGDPTAQPHKCWRGTPEPEFWTSQSNNCRRGAAGWHTPAATLSRRQPRAQRTGRAWRTSRARPWCTSARSGSSRPGGRRARSPRSSRPGCGRPRRG